MIYFIDLISICTCVGQHRSYVVYGLVLGITLYIGFRTGLHANIGTCRAWFGIRAFDAGASCSWARRTLSNLARLGTCTNTRRACRDRGFQNIFGHVRLRRALCLEHITSHVGLWWARGDGGTQNPFAGIGCKLGSLVGWLWLRVLISFFPYLNRISSSHKIPYKKAQNTC